MPTIEFEYPVSAEHCLDSVRRFGAAAVHQFVPTEEQQTLRAAVDPSELVVTDNTQAPVTERYSSKHFTYTENCPAPFTALGTRLLQWLGSSETTAWQPNDVLVQQYGPGDYITRHRDYKRSIGLVAIFTVGGHASFYAELDELPGETKIVTHPGSLVLMRAPGLAGPDGRPYHRIDAPLEAPRLAVTFRQTISR